MSRSKKAIAIAGTCCIREQTGLREAFEAIKLIRMTSIDIGKHTE